MSDPTQQIMPSADGTKVTGPGAVLMDNKNNLWRINTDPVKHQIVEWQPYGKDTWEAAGYTADVIQIEKWQDTCYQQGPPTPAYNSPTGWWMWDNIAPWVGVPDSPSAGGKPPIDQPPSEGTGMYYVSNGQIIGPTGQHFIAEGLCLQDNCMNIAITGADCKPLLDHYPTLNFVQIVNFSWTDPLPYQQQMDWLIAKGIVVMLGSYPTYPAVPYGDSLNQEVAWAQKIATRYKGVQNLWQATGNEPQDWYVGLPAGAISQEHVAMYNAIRAIDPDKIIFIGCTGCVSPQGLVPESYAGMHNVVWNTHYYNWLTNSTDYQTNVNAVWSVIADQQSIHSADGIIPCIIAEYGNATDGAHVDPGGWATVQACLDVGAQSSGGAAFVYPYWPSWQGGQPLADQLCDEASMTLTEYGKQVQTSYASTPQVAVASANAAKTWPVKLREKAQTA